MNNKSEIFSEKINLTSDNSRRTTVCFQKHAEGIQ